MPQGRGGKRPGQGKSRSARIPRRVLLQPGGLPRSASKRLSKHDVQTHPIVRLTDSGIDWGAWPKPGDEVGYGMHPHRGDDCFQAAIATCTQVPIEQVLDLALDRRFAEGEDRDEITRTSWERIDKWARKRGLQLAYSEEVPLPLERWIGVIEWEGNSQFGDMPPEFWRMARETEHGPRDSFLLPFQDHCVVMRHDRLLFDPTSSVALPPNATGSWRFNPSDVNYGVGFIKEK